VREEKNRPNNPDKLVRAIRIIAKRDGGSQSLGNRKLGGAKKFLGEKGRKVRLVPGRKKRAPTLM